jgi:murein hydrolase activator
LRGSWCITFFLLIVCELSVCGQSNSNKLKEQQRSIQKKIENTKTLIKATRSSKQLTIAEIGIIKNQISYREELISNLNYQIRKIEDQIFHAEKDIEVHKNNLKKLKADYAKMLRYAYKNRNTEYKLLYIFSANSLSQSYRRLKYLQEYASFRQKQAMRIIAEQNKLVEKKAELKERNIRNQELAGVKSTEKEKFLKDQELQKQELGKIMSDEARLQATLGKQEKKKKRLTVEIRKAIEAELAAARAKSGSKGISGFKETPEIKLASKSFESNKGKLPWPVSKGEITGKFGKHNHSVVKTAVVENNGIDISTTKGAGVRAIFKGEVSSILVIPGAGKVVMIKHGSYRSVYSNLQKVHVKKGEQVDTKEEIGQLLVNGNTSEAHIEIWKINSEGTMSKQNPEYWLYGR